MNMDKDHNLTFTDYVTISHAVLHIMSNLYAAYLTAFPVFYSTPIGSPIAKMILLALPTELRHKIYDCLTSESVSYPLGLHAITRISHAPPPTSSQRACRLLYRDITAYFWPIVTLYIAPGPFTANITDNAQSRAIIQKVRNMEVTMRWYHDGRIRGPIHGISPGKWPR